MDGLDGLLAGCMLIIISTAAIFYDPTLIVLSGSLSAFILFNWSPSKIFMGDAGSTYLGSVLVVILSQSQNVREFSLISLMSIPLLIDPFICLSRRYIEGENIFKPHSLHLFQRLYQAGWSHKKVSLLYISGTGLIALSSIFSSIIITTIITILVIIVWFFLDYKFRKLRE